MRILLSRRIAASAVLTLGLLGLAGCSMFSNDDPRYAPAPLTDYAPGISASIAWKTSIGSDGGYGFAPAVVEDTVYAATPNGKVSKVDLGSGAIQWQTDTDSTLSAGVGSDGRTTAVAANDGTVIALDDQGVEKWRTKATSAVNIPPAVGAGLVVVRSTDYRVQAFDAATGEPRWNVQRPGPALALKTNMQILVFDGVVIAGMPNGRIMIIDARSGNVQWEGAVSVSQGATDLERIRDVVGTPQVQGPLLCGVAYQGRMVCFDVSQGGRPIWDRPFSSHTGMTTDARQAYAADAHDAVHAFDLGTGNELWSQNALRNRRLTQPAVIAAGVAVGDFEGYVHFLSRSDGHLLGRLDVGGDPLVSPLVATTRGVLVQNSDGDLVLVGAN
ncbi:outer membrane protein assembly factor BamB [Allopusillimonas soli]|uniref:Outer membrane protein assembly factor BamB n=1 Tax=Allopusillimonas soli TaxID=659016 RepID=A0A853FA51_9BURK|nr:outer membrane protein assembly factor BamB [Allopusillimonas soli]NYT36983.1 outer membrane protein assembly factor BamB [Allopusillimonas soli]TEA75430.1 outer membrane protein assembly factor BamB [Allopusillimonas soli]